MGEINAEEQQMNDFFTFHSAQEIHDFFGPTSKRKGEMAGSVVLFCCDEIVIKGNQVHITNESMNGCMKKYPEWRHHVDGNSQSLLIKMNDNLFILSHQSKQMEKYQNTDDTDPWEAKILSITRATEYDDFKGLFNGMFVYVFL